MTPGVIDCLLQGSISPEGFRAFDFPVDREVGDDIWRLWAPCVLDSAAGRDTMVPEE